MPMPNRRSNRTPNCTLIALVAAASSWPAVASAQATAPYTASWTSLNKHVAAPEWFQDAKFGIYFHWGVYSVPAFYSEWYPRWMFQSNGNTGNVCSGNVNDATNAPLSC